MKKYIWLLALALLAIMLVLAACNGGTTPTTTATTTPTMTTTTTTTTPTITATTQPSGASNIPLSHGNPVTSSYEQCLVCHETGIAGATPIPASHAGRGNDTCQTLGCHQPS
jgi:nitrate reductase cytochrome c-type subunit